MKDVFRTIDKPSEGLYKEKGSKFIALAYPCFTEEEINQQITLLKKQYHDARHHCYAWNLGAEMERFRVNDDGEPSGTAGKPILGQMQSRELTNLLMVVIRYFGGTLLGTGGLIKAYRSAASDALDHSKIIEVKVFSTLKLKFEYAQLNAVMRIVKEFQLESENQHFDLDCSLTLHIWKRVESQVLARFRKIEGCTIVEAD